MAAAADCAGKRCGVSTGLVEATDVSGANRMANRGHVHCSARDAERLLGDGHSEQWPRHQLAVKSARVLGQHLTAPERNCSCAAVLLEVNWHVFQFLR